MRSVVVSAPPGWPTASISFPCTVSHTGVSALRRRPRTFRSRSKPFSSRGFADCAKTRLMQRAFDLLTSGCPLLLIWPLLALLALWVRLDLTGPVSFVQERMGRNGELFKILKFRTMQTDAEQSGPTGAIRCRAHDLARLCRDPPDAGADCAEFANPVFVIAVSRRGFG